MAGVKGIEQRPRFDSAHFTQNDPVRSPPECRLQRIFEGDVGLECIGLAFDRQNVWLLDVKLRGIFDDYDAILFWNEVGQNPQKCRLAGSGSTTDKQRFSTANLFC